MYIDKDKKQEWMLYKMRGGQWHSFLKIEDCTISEAIEVSTMYDGTLKLCLLYGNDPVWTSNKKPI